MTSSGDAAWQRPEPPRFEPRAAPPPTAQPTLPLPPPSAAPPPGPLTEGFDGPAFRAAQPTNHLAVVALILSLVGLVVGVTAPIGAVLGHRANQQIEQTRENGAGLARAAIIIGWAITGVGLILCCAGLTWWAVAAGTAKFIN